MMGLAKLMPAFRYMASVVLITFGIITLAWAYSKPDITFGEGMIGVIQKWGFLWSMILSISFGMALFMYHKGVSGKAMLLSVLAVFTALKFGLFMATMIVGVPFDASYAFGINAIAIAKAIVILLPALVFIIALITILIIKPENFWFAVIRIMFLAGLLVLLAIVVIPRVNALY